MFSRLVADKRGKHRPSIEKKLAGMTGEGGAVMAWLNQAERDALKQILRRHPLDKFESDLVKQILDKDERHEQQIQGNQGNQANQ